MLWIVEIMIPAFQDVITHVFYGGSGLQRV